jgi:hypothetical protein
MILKINRALIVGSIVGAALWVEHGNRFDDGAPADHAPVSVRTVCPDSDNVPYGTTCIAFLGGGAPINATQSSVALAYHDPSKHTDSGPVAFGNECPDNDNRPYTPSCIAFLSGWFWRAN